MESAIVKLKNISNFLLIRELLPLVVKANSIDECQPERDLLLENKCLTFDVDCLQTLALRANAALTARLLLA